MTEALAIVIVLLVAAFVISPLLGRTGGGYVETDPAGNELWSREKAVAVIAITEADFDRATGKLSDEDYRILRSDYESRTLHAMDEMEKLASPAAPPGTAGYCPACGARFAAADAFCGACGRARHDS